MSDGGHVAAVTGASRGIGRAIAVRVGSTGAAVAVAGRDETEGRVTVEQVQRAGGAAHFTRLDVTRADDVEAWIHETRERFGRLDWLVNNAGMNGSTARLEDYTVEEFERVVQTNLLSAFYAVRAAIPIMREQGSGSIVNVGSTASLQGSAPPRK